MLNEPVCIIRDASVSSQENDWWPKDTPSTPLRAPVVTKDTTQRSDYVDYKSVDRTKLGKRNYLATSQGIGQL